MMTRLRHYRGDLLALLTLFVLPPLWFAPVLFPGLTHATLLPYDNLYNFEPWRSLRPDILPYNDLLSDLVLENAVWKQHIRQTLVTGALPLWNPQIFTGLPFLAAGQASTFYPLNILFYLFPLEAAYGWFTALQIGLAGANLYLLGRVLKLSPLAALFSAVAYMFSGFMIVSVVFTMFMAAVVWLPLLLAIIEFIIQKQEEKGVQSFRPIPYVVAGAIAIGLLILAGHPELIYYTFLVAGLYSLPRLLLAWQRIRRATVTSNQQLATRILKLAAWLFIMVILGVAVGDVQLLPLLELVPLNFREGSASLGQILEWAWPKRHVLTFFLPNIFGNPSHHHWFDLWNREWMLATQNAFGEPNHTIFWGVKNYVEGGNYLGITTWLLALVAGCWSLVAGRPTPYTPRFTIYDLRFTTLFFTALATLSLLFAFGTPLYAILFYGLPGWSQLHSPFRWVFPFTLSMAILGGVGLQVLWDLGKSGDRRTHGASQTTACAPVRERGIGERGLGVGFRALVRGLAGLAMLVGIGTLVGVLVSVFLPEPFIALGQRAVNSSDLAQMAFADGRMFWGYQALNLVHFGLAAFLAGLLLWLITHASREVVSEEKDGHEVGRNEDLSQNQRFFPPNLMPLRIGFTERSSCHLVILSSVLITLVALDLYAAHGRFNPASDPALSPLRPENRPPVVDFIEAREATVDNPRCPVTTPDFPWRFTTFNRPGEKTFNANVGMYYGWHDLRGYDSIILGQYVQIMNRVAPQANELLYNRIAPLYSNTAGDVYAILDNPLLDLLNVKYVLTEHHLPNATWEEVYRDEAIGAYENMEVLPRAFIVPEAQVVPVAEQPLLESDLRQRVLIEAVPPDANALVPASPQLAEARISCYMANEVFVDLNLSDRGWLVLTDAYFPGWKAYLRPFGADESQEEELTIYRANSALRTVYLPTDGQWTVRFVYTPMSFKLGLYVTFLGIMALLLLLLWWGWGKYYRPESTAGEARTVAKNSLVPMLLNLTNKAIDFAFAMLYVRLLGPEGTGKYYFVVAIYGLFEILSRYGLGTLLTRDVAADKDQSSRYLTNVLALRTGLWLVTMPLLALVTYGYRTMGNWQILNVDNIGLQEVQAIAIFAFAMLFANWADALSSMFHAFEKMEYPAGLANAFAMIKVTLGALVLLLGWGFVGLAGVSLVVNILQVIWLYSLLRSTLFQPQWQWDWGLQVWMFRNSGPLMINHLLATIFWRIDVWILRPLAGAASVGLYSVGLKYLDGLNIVPSVFTMAIFPLMSRYAQRGDDALLRSYVISLRLLVMVSLPIAMMVTFIAEPLVRIVGGAQYLHVPETATLLGREISYLGGSALALQVIIWSIPIGFVNSVTQYVLISVNQQRYLTKAFIIGVLFNVIGNLLVIPSTGYIGAAVVTILSEFSLLIPFYYSVRRHVGSVPWLNICWSPVVAVAVMGVTIYALGRVEINVWLAVVCGWIVYGIVLLVTGAFRGADMAVVRRALPFGAGRGENVAVGTTTDL